jgi:hypothetical protein
MAHQHNRINNGYDVMIEFTVITNKSSGFTKEQINSEQMNTKNYAYLEQ